MLPLRTGETSFPLLMRSEFGVPLAHGASALLVLRLLDLHALLAAAGIGLVAGTGYAIWACALWLAFLFSPLFLFPFRDPVLALARAKLSPKFSALVDEIDDGIPRDLAAFLRAWVLTLLNWGVKVAVLAWVLGLTGVGPIAACFGGALGGELSSVLPVHAPAGVGTYPAGIAAGAAVIWGRQGCPGSRRPRQGKHQHASARDRLGAGRARAFRSLLPALAGGRPGKSEEPQKAKGMAPLLHFGPPTAISPRPEPSGRACRGGFICFSGFGRPGNNHQGRGVPRARRRSR